MSSEVCVNCDYETEKFGDIKPYLTDREQDFALFSLDTDDMTPLCYKCWNEQDKMDVELYKQNGINIRPLTWENPFPQNQKFFPTIKNEITTPTIINYNITSNTANTTNISNTSNLIPTYNTTNNTTNNNTTNIVKKEFKKKLTKLNDPDGLIDIISPSYKKILKDINQNIILYNAKLKEELKAQKLKEKEEKEKKQLELKLMKLEEQKDNVKLKVEKIDIKKTAKEMKKKVEMALFQEKLKEAEKTTVEEERAYIIKEQQDILEDKRKNEIMDQKELLFINERRRENEKIKNKKENEIKMIEDTYKVSFGDKNSVKQPDETLKALNGGLLTKYRCERCDTFKGMPNDFLNRFGKLTTKNHCSDCIAQEYERKTEYREANLKVCKCGIKYICITDEAKIRHEASDKHINAMKRNKKINGVVYNIKQLRKICNCNLNEDGTVKVSGAFKMSKEEIITKLLELDNIIIPNDL